MKKVLKNNIFLREYNNSPTSLMCRRSVTAIIASRKSGYEASVHPASNNFKPQKHSNNGEEEQSKAGKAAQEG